MLSVKSYVLTIVSKLSVVMNHRRMWIAIAVLLIICLAIGYALLTQGKPIIHESDCKLGFVDPTTTPQSYRDRLAPPRSLCVEDNLIEPLL